MLCAGYIVPRPRYFVASLPRRPCTHMQQICEARSATRHGSCAVPQQALLLRKPTHNPVQCRPASASCSAVFIKSQQVPAKHQQATVSFSTYQQVPAQCQQVSVEVQLCQRVSVECQQCYDQHQPELSFSKFQQLSAKLQQVSADFSKFTVISAESQRVPVECQQISARCQLSVSNI